METVYGLAQAQDWFLRHSAGSVLCIDGTRELECATFGEAKDFFNGK